MVYINSRDIIIIWNIMHMSGLFKILYRVMMRAEIDRIVKIRCNLKTVAFFIRYREIAHIGSV